MYKKRLTSQSLHRAYSGSPRRTSDFRGGGRFSRPIQRRATRGTQYIDPSKFINKAVITESVEHFQPEHQFTDFRIVENLKKKIIAKGYVIPTPIQDRAIPHILKGVDLVGTANTGTGAVVRATSPTFTTPTLGVASATSLATSAASPLLLTNGQLATIALTSQTVGGTTLTIPDFAGVVDEFTFKTKAQTLTNKTLTSPIIKGTKVVALTVTGGSVNTDASLGNVFTFSNTDVVTVNAPTNATDGQKCIWRFTNTAGSTKALTFTSVAGGFRFGTTVTASSGTLSGTVSNKTDYVGAIYNGDPAVQKWDVIAYAKGY